VLGMFDLQETMMNDPIAQAIGILYVGFMWLIAEKFGRK
jgi:hypothetical protein